MIRANFQQDFLRIFQWNAKRLEELLELLGDHWRKTLIYIWWIFCNSFSVEVGEPDNYPALRDEVLIYQLKMRNADKHEPIPGLKKITKMISKLHYYVLAEFLKD